METQANTGAITSKLRSALKGPIKKKATVNFGGTEKIWIGTPKNHAAENAFQFLRNPNIPPSNKKLKQELKQMISRVNNTEDFHIFVEGKTYRNIPNIIFAMASGGADFNKEITQLAQSERYQFKLFSYSYAGDDNHPKLHRIHVDFEDADELSITLPKLKLFIDEIIDLYAAIDPSFIEKPGCCCRCS